MWAEVPPMFCSKLPIVTNYELVLILSFFAIYKVTMQVIIFVREAISDTARGLNETMTL